MSQSEINNMRKILKARNKTPKNKKQINKKNKKSKRKRLRRTRLVGKKKEESDWYWRKSLDG